MVIFNIMLNSLKEDEHKYYQTYYVIFLLGLAEDGKRRNEYLPVAERHLSKKILSLHRYP